MLYWPEAPVSVGAPTEKVHGVGIAAEPLHQVSLQLMSMLRCRGSQGDSLMRFMHGVPMPAMQCRQVSTQ